VSEALGRSAALPLAFTSGARPAERAAAAASPLPSALLPAPRARAWSERKVLARAVLDTARAYVLSLPVCSGFLGWVVATR
jgi:hypothetical protein